MIKIERALISVYDKQNLNELAHTLKEAGCSIISTGGTAKQLSAQGVACEHVEALTKFPEVLGGRVKTLHPAVFAGLLTRGTSEDETELKQHGLQPISLVVVNLYPFEQKLSSGELATSEMLEFIDIGGVSLLRAAAKNYPRCVVLSSVDQYQEFLVEFKEGNGAISEELSQKFATQAFSRTAQYDKAISAFFARESDQVEQSQPAPTLVKLDPKLELAYGENPHQKGFFYDVGDGRPSLLPKQLSGKPLSYNNLVDLNGCLGTLTEFPRDNACVIVKHSNPCGVGIAQSDSVLEAYENALAGDPVSAFGGIIGFTKTVDQDVAEKIVERFYEIVVAPAFTDEALATLQTKKKLRLLVCDPAELHGKADTRNLQQTLFGFLEQERDASMELVASGEVVTKRQPTEEEMTAMQLAWAVVKWVKSNAIVLAKGKRVVGIGAGQMSRVDAVELAIKKADEHATESVLASDAFFPFADGVENAHKGGITAVVQPGGSIRDQEVIAAADKLGMAMVFTGRRHFRH